PRFPRRRRPRRSSRRGRRAATRTPSPSAPSSAGRTRAPRGSPRAPPRRPEASRGGLRQRWATASIPRDRPLQPVVELDLRFETDLVARLFDIGDAQLDVDVIEGREDDLARTAGEPLDSLREVEDRHGRARIADVVALPDRVRM